MHEVITIGSAVVDIFIKSSDFHLHKVSGDVMLCQNYGEKIEVDSFNMHSGGGATNVAVGLDRLGVHTAIVAEMGKDTFAQTIIRELEREEVDTSLLIREKREQTGGSVILSGEDGGRTILVHRGAASELDVTDLPMGRLQKARWWHLSSISGKLDVLRKLFTTARLHSIGLSWNPGSSELRLLNSGQLAVHDITAEILFLNLEEWESIRDLQDQVKSQVPQIIVTNGAHGGLVFNGHAEQPFKAHDVKSIDDTGAGDAFVSGYVGAHLRGLSQSEAIKWGKANAAASIQKIGAKPGLLSRAQIETMTQSKS